MRGRERGREKERKRVEEIENFQNEIDKYRSR